MKGQLYINNKDAWITWGVSLESGSKAKLLTPAANKDNVTNNVRSQHGKQVLRNNPRKSDRDLILIFCIGGENEDQFLVRYHSFIDELDSGLVELKLLSIKTVYRLDTLSYQELSYYDGIGKIAVRFNESNPSDRIYPLTIIHALSNDKKLLSNNEKILVEKIDKL